MSVNLNKPDKQRHKVSLRKEELNKEAAGLEEGVQKRKKPLPLLIGIAAAALLLLIEGIGVRNSASKEDEVSGEMSAMAVDHSAESADAEADVNELVISGKDTSTEGVIEDFQNQNDAEAEMDSDGELAVAEAGERLDDSSIHEYELIIADVTWSEAFADCISRGGYLCRINSAEENEKIKVLLDDEKNEGIYIAYLGGMRDDDSEEYHWVDCNKKPYDDVINEEEYTSFWYAGEPSYTDNVNDREIVEKYMAFIYPGATKEWCWNDVNDDVLSLAQDYYSGRISYICEYE